MRILIISRGFPTADYNLNGIFEFDQAKALSQVGNEVIFAAIDVRSIRRWRRWGFVNKEKDGVYIEAVNLPIGRLPNILLNKIRQIALKRLYKRIIKKYGQIDIIHSHFIDLGYVSAKVFQNEDIPLVHTEHFSGMNQEKITNHYTKVGNYTYRYMNRVIAVSEYLKRNLKIKFGVDTTVVPNIVDISDFQYESIKKKQGQFQFISVGSLTKNKRMDLLIRAFRDAFKDKMDVSLYIYGEGPERKKLEDYINTFQLANQVFLMGLKERKIIAKKMQESHCFVLASKLETFGVSYIEAMAMGLPVITTKCGGPEDFVNLSTGIIIPVDNQRELSMAMQEMMINIGTYNGESIANGTISKFSSNIISKQLMKIYLEVIKK